MKQVVIIGGSLAGVKAAEEIRALDAASTIRILLGENHPPFLRQNFSAFLANEIPLEKLFAREKNFYEQNQIQLVFDKKISRVNFRKSQIFFEDKDKADYDVLILTDMPPSKLPDIKGNHRSGVFGLRRVTDVTEIAKLLAVSETVVIQSQTLSGLRLAAALRRREKEVIWVTPGSRLLADFVDEETSRVVRGLVEEAGVRLMDNNEIDEVLGDTDAKAVRLKSGKVFSAQIVIYPDAAADLKLFKETDLQFSEKVPVNARFQTNISNVYAVDDVCCCESGMCPNWDDSYEQILDQQVKSVTAAINDQGMVAEYPLPTFTCAVAGHVIQFIGQTRPREITRVVAGFEPEEKKFRQILIEKDAAVGAVLINNVSEKERFMQFIRERKSVSQEGHILPGKLLMATATETPEPLVTLQPVPPSGTGRVSPHESRVDGWDSMTTPAPPPADGPA